jgi:hypothetical protein
MRNKLYIPKVLASVSGRCTLIQGMNQTPVKEIFGIDVSITYVLLTA